MKETEWNMLSHYYDTSYFFGSRALKETTYATIELKQVYRQNDPYFLSLLNKVRENKADEQTLAELNQRYIPNFHPAKEKDISNSPLTITKHNRLMITSFHSSKNRFQLQGRSHRNFPEYSYPTDETLMLKKERKSCSLKMTPHRKTLL